MVYNIPITGNLLGALVAKDMMATHCIGMQLLPQSSCAFHSKACLLFNPKGKP